MIALSEVKLKMETPETELKPEFPRPTPEPPVVSQVEQAQTFISGEEGALTKLKKFLLPLFLVLILLVGGAVAFKFLSPRLAKPSEINLTYWGLWEEEKIFNEIIADYQKEHPNIKITYFYSSPKEYRERLISAFARGEGPDIFRFHNTWVPMLKNELALIPPEVFNAALFESTFYPVTRNDLRMGAFFVGIPLEIDGLGLYINEDIFRAAGKNPPTTWDELRQTALQLTVKDSQGRIQIAGVALGRTENVDHWSDILALMMLQNGADLSHPGGSLAEDALTFFTLFSEQDNVWEKTLPASTLAFAGGKLAMYFAPSWRVFEIKKMNPRLAFRVVPVPQLPETNISWASYWVEGVSKRSKNQQEAWEFLKYLSAQQTLQRFYQLASQTRLFGEPYSRVEMADLLKDDPFVGAYLKQAPVARSWYLASRTFDNGINDKLIKYFEDAVNAVNAGETAKEALQTTAQGVAQVLAQYGLSSPVVR